MVLTPQLRTLQRKLNLPDQIRLHFRSGLADYDMDCTAEIFIFDLIVGIDCDAKYEGVAFFAALLVMEEGDF